jgi:hypothetical protein
MKTKLVNFARIWGTGVAILFLTSLALSMVFWPAVLMNWALQAVHVSLDLRLWVALAYGVTCAPFFAYYLARLFGIRARKIPAS